MLADFDVGAEDLFGINPRKYEKLHGSSMFWKKLREADEFFFNLPLMDDARELYDNVKHLKPIIITGCPRGDWAQPQKRRWAEKHFPGVPVITCASADKRNYADPGDVLIDDWPQYRHKWVEMGGVFISHFCARTSLNTLWAHKPEWREQC